MAIKNLITLEGTLFSKESREVPNKKEPENPYVFLSIKLETKVQVSGNNRTLIPEIHLDRGVGFDEFSVNDPIKVDCYASGKKISDIWYKTELRAVKISFADLDASGRRPKSTGATNTKETDDFPISKIDVSDETEYDLPF